MPGVPLPEVGMQLGTGGDPWGQTADRACALHCEAHRRLVVLAKSSREVQIDDAS